jgi:VIT1/CCC1 family predicted Fe2+/Mn2+ transporter
VLTPAATSHPSQEPARPAPIPRAVIAVIMLLIAAFGATTAYWTARTEQSVSQLERRTTLGKMIEVAFMHQGAAEGALNGVFASLREEHVAQAKQYLADARAKDRSDLYVAAQHEGALARIDSTLESMVPTVHTRGGADGEAALESSVREHMVKLGYGLGVLAPATDASGDDSESCSLESVLASLRDALERRGSAAPAVTKATDVPSSADIWSASDTRLRTYRSAIPELAIGIVLLVGALLCLTVADVFGARVWLSIALVVASLALTAQATSRVCSCDPGIASRIAWTFVGWAALVAAIAVPWLVARALRRKAGLESAGEPAHPPEYETTWFPGLALVQRHVHGLQQSGTVILIAVTAVLSALDGYWYTQAKARVDDAAHEAFESELSLGTRVAKGIAAATDDLEDESDLLSTRLACDLLTQVGRLPNPAASDHDETPCVRLMKDERLKAIAAKVDAGTLDSPAAVRHFAEAYSEESRNPAEALALALGFTDLAGSWTDKAIYHLLALTLYSLTLYLFGQSLGMGRGPAASVLLIAALGLGATTTYLATRAHSSAPARPTPATECGPAKLQSEGSADPDEGAVRAAASVYGKGWRALQLASSREDYMKAAGLLRCVTALRPDLSMASDDLAAAYAYASSPDLGNDYMNFPTKETLDAQVEAQVHSFCAMRAAGGMPSPDAINSLGFALLLRGLGKTGLEDVKAARTTFEHGLDLVKRTESGPPQRLGDEIVLRANLAVVKLALREKDDAVATYTALAKTLETPRSPNDRDGRLLASIVTDLDNLSRNCSRLYPSDASACAAVASDVDAMRDKLLQRVAGEPPQNAEAKHLKFQPWATSASRGWRGVLDYASSGRDTVAVVWQRRISEWGVWETLQSSTYQQHLPEGAPTDSFDWYRDDDFTCAPEGSYEAALYLNGMRQESVTIDIPASERYGSREMNVMLCGPAGWALETPALKGVDGERHLVRRLVASDGRTAGFLFTAFTGRDFSKEHAASAADLQKYCRAAWTLAKKDWHFDDPLSDDEACNPSSLASLPDVALSACSHHRVWRKQWVTRQGVVHVGFIGADAVPDGQACRVAASIGNFYDRGDDDGLSVGSESD